MAVKASTAADLFLGRHSCQTYLRAMSLATSVAAKNGTTYASQANEEFYPGLLSSEGSATLLRDITAATGSGPDPSLFNLERQLLAATYLPDDVTAGSVAYFQPSAMLASYPVISNEVGEISEVDFDLTNGTSEIYRGLLLRERATRTASSNSAVYNFGTVPTTSKVGLLVHVFAYTSGTLQVVLQSDDGVGMPSPTARATLSGINAVGTYYAEAAGPAGSEAFWRCADTMASTPSMSYAVVFGKVLGL